MPSWWESAKNIAKNAYCEVAEFGEWYAGGVATLLDETRLDELAEFQLEYAQWANRKFCGKKPSTSVPDFLKPKFTGGQCIGVSYRIQARGNVPSVSTQPSLVNASLINVVRTGAIVDVGIRNNPTNYVLFVVHAGGTSDITNFSKASWGQPVYTSITVTRTDGLPDNCGSLSPSVPPNSNPLVVVRDIDYDDESGTPQTDEDVTFTFDTPIREPDGTVSIPYTICKDGFCVKGKVNLGDELIASDDSPSEEYLTPVVELDDPEGGGTVTPESELDGEPLSEADKEKTPILGVFVKAQESTGKPRSTAIFMNDGAPAILAPNIGFVRFRILHGDESGWLADIPIKSVNAYIPVPDKMEAVSCEVSFQSGWKGKWIIHRGKACCKECEESDN